MFSFYWLFTFFSFCDYFPSSIYYLMYILFFPFFLDLGIEGSLFYWYFSRKHHLTKYTIFLFPGSVTSAFILAVSSLSFFMVILFSP